MYFLVYLYIIINNLATFLALLPLPDKYSHINSKCHSFSVCACVCTMCVSVCVCYQTPLFTLSDFLWSCLIGMPLRVNVSVGTMVPMRRQEGLRECMILCTDFLHGSDKMFVDCRNDKIWICIKTVNDSPSLICIVTYPLYCKCIVWNYALWNYVYQSFKGCQWGAPMMLHSVCPTYPAQKGSRGFCVLLDFCKVLFF